MSPLPRPGVWFSAFRGLSRARTAGGSSRRATRRKQNGIFGGRVSDISRRFLFQSTVFRRFTPCSRPVRGCVQARRFRGNAGAPRSGCSGMGPRFQWSGRSRAGHKHSSGPPLPKTGKTAPPGKESSIPLPAAFSMRGIFSQPKSDRRRPGSGDGIARSAAACRRAQKNDVHGFSSIYNAESAPRNARTFSPPCVKTGKGL